METRVNMACQQSVTGLPLSEYRCDSFVKQPCLIAKMDVIMCLAHFSLAIESVSIWLETFLCRDSVHTA